MDRLIIESILSNVQEVYLVEDGQNGSAVVLDFIDAHADQVANALSALKKIASEEQVEFIVCKTVQPGIYDLEIKTEALDEPIRMMNKSITEERLTEFGQEMNSGKNIALSSNFQDAQKIRLSGLKIKECAAIG